VISLAKCQRDLLIFIGLEFGLWSDVGQPLAVNCQLELIKPCPGTNTKPLAFCSTSGLGEVTSSLTTGNLCYNFCSYSQGGSMRATVTQIGNSTGLILPKEVAARLKVKKGDSVYLTETPEGYSVTPYDPGFEEQMESARKGMARYRNALKELAK